MKRPYKQSLTLKKKQPKTNKLKIAEFVVLSNNIAMSTWMSTYFSVREYQETKNAVEYKEIAFSTQFKF